MLYVYGFLDDKRVLRERMNHLPRVGDTMRFSGERYGKVTDVVWCMDEDVTTFQAQRINLRIETIDVET